MEKTKKTTNKTVVKSMVKKKSGLTKLKKTQPVAHGVGRRKSSVARVWMRKGKGSVIVNNKDYRDYFDTEPTRLSASAVLRLYNNASSFDFAANVKGGGLWGQADAVKLAMSRALFRFDKESGSVLRQYGLLTVDSRIKERKKYGQRGARRKFQFVKR